MLREGQFNRIGREVLTTGPLNADDRVLHYILSYVLQPRGSNHAVITDSDVPLLFVVKNRLKFSWAEEICHHMMRCRNFSSLPFGFHISHLLRISNVDLSGEVVVQPKLHTALINKTYLQNKLDLHWNKGRRAYDYAGGSVKVFEAREKASEKKAGSSRKASLDSDSLLERVNLLASQVTDVQSHLNLIGAQVEDSKKFLSERLDRMESMLVLLLHGQPSQPDQTAAATTAEGEVAGATPAAAPDAGASSDADPAAASTPGVTPVGGVEAEYIRNEEIAVSSTPAASICPDTALVPYMDPVDSILQNVIYDVSKVVQDPSADISDD